MACTLSSLENVRGAHDWARLSGKEVMPVNRSFLIFIIGPSAFTLVINLVEIYAPGASAIDLFAYFLVVMGSLVLSFTALAIYGKQNHRVTRVDIFSLLSGRRRAPMFSRPMDNWETFDWAWNIFSSVSPPTASSSCRSLQPGSACSDDFRISNSQILATPFTATWNAVDKLIFSPTIGVIEGVISDLAGHTVPKRFNRVTRQVTMLMHFYLFRLFISRIDSPDWAVFYVTAFFVMVPIIIMHRM
jgi:hypothetical protein